VTPYELGVALPDDPASGEREDAGYWMNKCEEALKRSGENKARADAADAEVAALREALEKAAIYVERARLSLSFAKQDAVSSAAEAESNKNSAFHDCVKALGVLKAAKAVKPKGAG
jgi:hypothetical protein